MQTFLFSAFGDTFGPEELVNHNVNGGHGRLGFNSVKLQEVNDIFCHVYPCKDPKKESQICVNAINAHLRKYKKNCS